MEHLKQLAAAGYQHGYTNGHGADDTVSGIEWALSHLLREDDANAAQTAETYSGQAAANLESRLFAAYVVRSLAAIKLSNLDMARGEYEKARALAQLAQCSYGQIPSLSEAQIEETLAVVERRLRTAGISL